MSSTRGDSGTVANIPSAQAPAMNDGAMTWDQPPAFAKPFERVCQVFFRGYCRLEVEGQHRLPAGPFIICSNHESHMDSVALMTASKQPFARFGLLAAKDYFFDHALKRRCVSSLLHIIPVSRAPAGDLLQSITIAQDFLKRTGGILILYPEGTRSRAGDMAPFKRGAGLFAAKLGVPVVPAWIQGGGRAMPKGSLWPRPGLIKVRFGDPIQTESGDMADLTRRELPRRLIAAVERQVRALGQGGGAAS
jgi:1-acyl-sn-glycerol-3-phosphate acyltransferase